MADAHTLDLALLHQLIELSARDIEDATDLLGGKEDGYVWLQEHVVSPIGVESSSESRVPGILCSVWLNVLKFVNSITDAQSTDQSNKWVDASQRIHPFMVASAHV
jgi:hypothetical protein